VSEGESIAGKEREVVFSSSAPSALSREQVATLVDVCITGNGVLYNRESAKEELLSVHAAQRATIAQQAQEIERLRKLEIDLGDLRLRLNCPPVAPSCLVCGHVEPLVITHLEATAIGVCEECRSAAQQLAAMTRERDEIRQAKNAMTIELYRKLDEKDEQLSTAQARIKELEMVISETLKEE